MKNQWIDLSAIWTFYMAYRWFHCLMFYCLYFSALIFCLHILLGRKYRALGTLRVWSTWPTNSYWCSFYPHIKKKQLSLWFMSQGLLHIGVDARITSYQSVQTVQRKLCVVPPHRMVVTNDLLRWPPLWSSDLDKAITMTTRHRVGCR